MRRRRALPDVIGLDLSLRAPAACRIPAGWVLGDWASLDVREWRQPEPAHEGESSSARDREEERRQRCKAVAEAVVEFVAANLRIQSAARASRELPDPDFPFGSVSGTVVPPRIFVEDYAFSAHSSSVTRLAELRGVVRQALWACFRATASPVRATAARKLLLGRLPREDQKLAVQGALYRAGAPLSEKLTRPWRGVPAAPRYGRAEPWGEDACDAVAVANFGLSECGLTPLSLA